MPCRGGGRQVDVDRIAAGAADDLERQVHHRPLDLVGLADQDGGAEVGEPSREVVSGVHLHRLLLEPWLVDDVAQRFEQGKAVPAHRCNHKRSGPFGHNE